MLMLFHDAIVDFHAFAAEPLLILPLFRLILSFSLPLIDAITPYYFAIIFIRRCHYYYLFSLAMLRYHETRPHTNTMA